MTVHEWFIDKDHLERAEWEGPVVTSEEIESLSRESDRVDHLLFPAGEAEAHHLRSSTFGEVGACVIRSTTRLLGGWLLGDCVHAEGPRCERDVLDRGW